MGYDFHLIHFSDDPELALVHKEQVQGSTRPKGLWLAHGLDWVNFVRRNPKRARLGRYRYEVKVNAQIAKITSENAADYAARYGNNWQALAQAFEGVEVTQGALSVEPWSVFEIPSLCLWDISGAEVRRAT